MDAVLRGRRQYRAATSQADEADQDMTRTGYARSKRAQPDRALPTQR